MLIGVGFAALPFLLIAALFALTGRHQRRRLAEVERQIRVTDALHARIGAVVAPVVRHPFGGPWEIHVATPLERRAVVDSLVDVVRAEFGTPARRGAELFRIVLTAAIAPEVDRLTRPNDRTILAAWLRRPRPRGRWAGPGRPRRASRPARRSSLTPSASRPVSAWRA